MKNALLRRKSRIGIEFWKYLTVFAIDAVIFFVIIFYRDIISIMKVFPTCPMYMIGLRCATCGGTRCVSALMRLDILSAVRLNFPVVLFCIYAVITLILSNICLFTQNTVIKKAFIKLFSGKAAIFWALFFAAYTVLRNISLVLFKFEF